MTGTSAAEKEIPGSRADKLHRGRNVVMAFTMQVAPCPSTPPPKHTHIQLLGSCYTGNIMQEYVGPVDIALSASSTMLLAMTAAYSLAVIKHEEVVRLPVACNRSVTGAGLGSTCQPWGADGGSAGLQWQGWCPLQSWLSWSNLQILICICGCADCMAGLLQNLALERG